MPASNALQEAHAKAAQYYLQLAAAKDSAGGWKSIADVQPLIEAVWQLCQAGKYGEAYQLLYEKNLFGKLSSPSNFIWRFWHRFRSRFGWDKNGQMRLDGLLRLRGANTDLLELCQLLLNSDWQWAPEQKSLIVSNIAPASNVLGRKQEALDYYGEALKIRREVGDRGGEGTTLWNIGAFYLDRQQYDVALASFLLAREIYKRVQSPDADAVERWITNLRKRIGETAFAALLAQVESRAEEIVERALHDDVGSS